jgi:paraquat-inducible protein B
MTSRASRTAIGAFVLGGAVVAVVAALVVGAGEFTRRHFECVLFFQGSVSGLDVGASVDFRGVKVGYVSDIIVQFDPRTSTIQIPVIIAIEPDRFTLVGADLHRQKAAGPALAELVAGGLRARLKTESLITGVLAIELDFRPEQPARLVGGYPRLPELPTVPSSTEELSRTIRAIPVEEISKQTLLTLRDFDAMVNSADLPASARAVTAAAGDLRQFIQNLDMDVRPALKELAATARALRELVDYLEQHPEALIRGKSSHEGKGVPKGE